LGEWLFTMLFDSSRYGNEVQSLLSLDGDGHRLMALEAGACSSERARSLLKTKAARDLFPQSRAPEAALSGLWLYFGCFDESHTISQEISTAEGSYWHGIAHRQEPDPGNAAYWFRRVGNHSIFPPLRDAAAELTASAAVKLVLQDRWDPFAFIDFCEEARRRPGTDAERVALEIQRAEWQLLFDYCAAVQQ
jgi:hypothetical protein